MGKLHVHGDLENLSVGHSHPSEQQANTIQYQRRIKRGSINLARKYSQACFYVLCFNVREEAGQEIYSLQTLRRCTRMTLHKLC